METIDLLTVDSLDDYDPAFIEDVRKAISLKTILIRQAEFDGMEVGITLDEYLDFLNTRRPHTCPACQGKGTVLPKKRSVGTIHPSSATRCRLRLYKDVMGKERTAQSLPLGLRITFQIGHAVHDLLQTTLHNAAKWDEEYHAVRLREDPENPPKKLIGHTDWLDAIDFDFEDEAYVELIEALIDGGHTDGVAILNVFVDGREVRVKVVLEIKTMSEKQFVKLSKPKDDHRVQAHGLYATACDAPFICYLYVDKGFPHPIAEYVETYDHGVYSKWRREKCDPIEEAIEEGVEPVADANKWECEDCSYNKNCAQRVGKKRTKSRLTR